MNLGTRQALNAALNEMGRARTKLEERKETLVEELNDVEGELAIIQQRAKEIQEDLKL